jgi:phosphomannomutase
MALERLSAIFRLYDVRGIYGSDLAPEVMARIGLALSHYWRGDYAVGMDTRLSSPPLHLALVSGILAGGSNVVDVGTVPIGAAMYATLHKGYAAAYITASHLPPEWNGVKLFKQGGDPMVGDEIQKLREIFFSAELKPREPGHLARLEILPEYARFLRSKAAASDLRIVVDCGNGAASLIAPRLLRDLGHEVYALNADVDPRFPGRGSEPTPDRLKDLASEVVRRRAHFGVAFDGDGDRTVFVDNTGRVLTAEQAAVVMLEGMGYGDVVANVECSMVLEELVKARGYRVRWVPVGRTFMVREIAKSGAALGVESSGHYVVWRNANMDDGLLTMLYFAEAAAKLGRVSEVVPPQYPIVRRKVEVPDELKFRVVEEMRKELEGKYEVNTLDGVKAVMEDAWVLIRASNTEPLIRVTCEAKRQGTAERLADEYAAKVREVAERLSRRS